MKPLRTLVQVSSYRPRGLDLLSWQDRRTMLFHQGRPATIKKLIELMGPLHVLHPSYVERPRSLLPMPNLAGRQPVIEAYDGRPWSQIKMLLSWMAR